MIGLFDRDVFIKLGCCNLGIEAIQALAICQPYKLASLQSAASNRRAVGRHFSGEALEHHLGLLEAFNKQVDVIPNIFTDDLPHDEHFLAMSEKDSIDIGEQILTALVIKNAGKSVMLTGDKKFIASIRNECPIQWDLIEKYTITFEQCLLSTSRMFGFQKVAERALPARNCDMTLRACLHDGSTEDTFVEALKAYTS